ncbi:hypothetical protein RB195_017098 [Necator americanus]|uniref:Uncharacterized protein n=1 Tax=Necator americanus TaxID=51031 RepID=A0ABR1C5S7_NECAM
MLRGHRLFFWLCGPNLGGPALRALWNFSALKKNFADDDILRGYCLYGITQFDFDDETRCDECFPQGSEYPGKVLRIKAVKPSIISSE